MKRKDTSRDKNLKLSNTLWRSAKPIRESFSYLLFLTFPALICGCMASELQETGPVAPDSSAASIGTTQARTTALIEGKVKSLDIFTFEDDILERLDSYQRFDEGVNDDHICSIASCQGEKTMILIANSAADRYEWSDINCRKALEKKTFSLEDESLEFPLMTAEHHIRAGTSFSSRLAPMTAEVVLRSIRCDFFGQSYAGEKMTDVKIYLTNVNASYGIWSREEAGPSRIINGGRLDSDCLERFRHPEIIFREIRSPIGTDRTYPDIRFRTFPNSYPEESMGTPFTRLIIEGKIKGHTYYYPIPINRGKEAKEPGIRRNRSYIYDLEITRTGLTDPDGAIEGLTIIADMEVEEWKEKDWYEVRF